MVKNISINDRNVRMKMWDTAEQEAYRSINRSYYKNSTCAFIVYDITEKKLSMMLRFGYKIEENFVLKMF